MYILQNNIKIYVLEMRDTLSKSKYFFAKPFKSINIIIFVVTFHTLPIYNIFCHLTLF